MSIVSAFYSVNEVLKAAAHRVHHTNNVCPSGRDIPQNERRSGEGGYRECENCQYYTRHGK